MTETERLIEDITPLIVRFPYFPVSNVSYNRNFVEIINNLYKQENRQMEHIQDLALEATDRFGLKYREILDCDYDRQKLKSLQETLERDFLPLHSAISFRSIEEDFGLLKKKEEWENLAKKLVRMAPFIYDATGQALQESSSIDAIQLGPVEIRSRYTDTFKAHQAGLISLLSNQKGMGELHRYVRNVIGNFIPREIIPATSLYTSEKTSVTERELFLEEVPALYTPLRGALAGDCSMISVPYFGVLNNTKVFWVIQKSGTETKPSGYAFVAEILGEKGQKIPYIITINGPSISESDCYAIFHLLQKYYETDEIFVADVKNVDYLVNTHSIESAMSSLKGQSQMIELPQGWDSISELEMSASSYKNYYARNRLEKPKNIILPQSSIHIIKTYPNSNKVFYPKHEDISKIKLINRALLGHYFLIMPSGKEKREEVLSILKLTDEHIIHIKTLVNYYRTGEILPIDFSKLNEIFDFGLKDLMNLDIHYRAPILWSIYDEHKNSSLFTASQWNDLCRKTFDELKEKLLLVNYRPEKDSLKDYLASVPDEYIPEYWDVISPYLFLDGQSFPDYYMLRRFVKYFHSYGTIEQFLAFLSKNPEAIPVVEPEDNRWLDFLLRAKALMSDSKDLHIIYDQIFHTIFSDSKNNLSLYDVRKRLEAGITLGLEFSLDFLRSLVKTKGWNEEAFQYLQEILPRELS